MVLRALIVIQIAWVTLLGVVARGVFPASPLLGWAEAVIFPVFTPALVAFPVGVNFALRRSALPPWKHRAVVGIEAALCFASLIAVLPAVQ